MAYRNVMYVSICVAALVGMWFIWRAYSAMTHTVVLVFPNSFFGLAKVCLDKPTADVMNNHEATIEFDHRGSVVVGNGRRLLQWNKVIARRQDGTRIPLWDRNIQQLPTADQPVGIWQSSGPLGNHMCIYFFVGTSGDEMFFQEQVLKDAFGPNGSLLDPGVR